VHILFDQGTPVPLRNLLNPHHIETVFERGWNTLTNGELLARAEEHGFEIFITTDKNLPHQQNLAGRRIAFIVLSSTSWPRIRNAADAIKQAIATTPFGAFSEVQIP